MTFEPCGWDGMGDGTLDENVESTQKKGETICHEVLQQLTKVVLNIIINSQTSQGLEK